MIAEKGADEIIQSHPEMNEIIIHLTDIEREIKQWKKMSV